MDAHCEHHTTHGPAETEQLAARIAATLRPGDLLALRGGLGAGKTCFVRGLAEGLGLDPQQVGSPTFSLVNEYRAGGRVLYHFDMYRVTNDDDLYHTGFYDYLDDPAAVLAVEWSENIDGALPDDRITVTITPDGEDTRHITVQRGRAQ